MRCVWKRWENITAQSSGEEVNVRGSAEELIEKQCESTKFAMDGKMHLKWILQEKNEYFDLESGD